MNQEIIASHPELDAAGRTFDVLLSSTPRGARLARLLAADQLREWGVRCEAARHVVAELAANAATHGRLPGRSFRLRLQLLGGTLRIEVSDTRGDRWPAPQEPDAVAESGRGLLLVEAFADRWGVTAGRFPLKIVWAELRLGAPGFGSPEPGAPEPGTPCSGAAGR